MFKWNWINVSFLFIGIMGLIVDTNHDWAQKLSPVMNATNIVIILLKLFIIVVAVYRTYAAYSTAY